VDGLGARLRDTADALGKDASIEATWLRGAADLVERDQAERNAARVEAIWLEELASEARARKTVALSAWVDAAEALRTAIHALESERGPLVESLFPEWRGPSLRRHAAQACAAETELQRRLASGYVVRRLAELATHDALGGALEALAAAGTRWAAVRDRPSLAGPEANAVRTRLLALAGRTAHVLERVRWVVRAALTDRPELVEEVFPRRTRPSQAPRAETAAPDAGATTELAAPPSPGPAGPMRRRSGAAARRPARADASEVETAGSAARPDAPPSSEPAGPDTALGGTLRSRRPGRSTGGSTARSRPDPSEGSASGAGRSTDTPSAAPDAQPSARGSSRKRRPPRGK